MFYAFDENRPAMRAPEEEQKHLDLIKKHRRRFASTIERDAASTNFGMSTRFPGYQAGYIELLEQYKAVKDYDEISFKLRVQTDMQYVREEHSEMLKLIFMLKEEKRKVCDIMYEYQHQHRKERRRNKRRQMAGENSVPTKLPEKSELKKLILSIYARNALPPLGAREALLHHHLVCYGEIKYMLGLEEVEKMFRERHERYFNLNSEFKTLHSSAMRRFLHRVCQQKNS